MDVADELAAPIIELNAILAAAAVNLEFANEIGLPPRCGDDEDADEA